MDFSPQSLFWDCMYARCCEEMDTYLKPGSFWSRIPDGGARVLYSFAMRYEGWRWYHELHFWKNVAERVPECFRNEKAAFEKIRDERTAISCSSWSGLSHREKVQEAKKIVRLLESSSVATLEDYLRSGKCVYRDVTNREIDAALGSKPPAKRLIADKLVAGVESLGWRWQYGKNGCILYGDVSAFGRTFNLVVEFEDKYQLCYSLRYAEAGCLKLSESYGFLMGLGSGSLESFGATDLDADVETFTLMLSRLAWLVATSLDDAEKGLKPEFVHHAPPVEEVRTDAVCVYFGSAPEISPEEKALLELMKAEGFVGADVRGPLDLFGIIESVAQFGSARLFLLDTECVDDGSEYAAILEKLNDVSGEKVVEDVTSFFDLGKNVAGVQFAVGGKVYKGRWRQDDDWMSAEFAELLSKAMEHFSGRFVALPGGDQCARILYFKSRDAGDKVEKLLERIKAEKKR